MTATVTLQFDVTNLMVRNELTNSECERIMKDYLRSTQFGKCSEFHQTQEATVKISE